MSIYRSGQTFRTEMFTFHGTIQWPGQSVEDYITVLRKNHFLGNLVRI